jgi:hypothetical protein
VAEVSREDWAVRRVADCMVPTARVAPVAPDDEPMDALARLQEPELNRAPVLDGDRLVGLLSITDEVRALGLRGMGRRPGPAPRWAEGRRVGEPDRLRLLPLGFPSASAMVTTRGARVRLDTGDGSGPPRPGAALGGAGPGVNNAGLQARHGRDQPIEDRGAKARGRTAWCAALRTTGPRRGWPLGPGYTRGWRAAASV